VSNVRKFPGGDVGLLIGGVGDFDLPIDPTLTPYEQGRRHYHMHGPLAPPPFDPEEVRAQMDRHDRQVERHRVECDLLRLVAVFAQNGRDAESAAAEARKAFELAAALELVPEVKP